MRNHDWNDLSLDYETASVLNEVDQKKEEMKWKALSGEKIDRLCRSIYNKYKILSPFFLLSINHKGCKFVKWKQTFCSSGSNRLKDEQGNR